MPAWPLGRDLTWVFSVSFSLSTGIIYISWILPVITINAKSQEKKVAHTHTHTYIYILYLFLFDLRWHEHVELNLNILYYITSFGVHFSRVCHSGIRHLWPPEQNLVQELPRPWLGLCGGTSLIAEPHGSGCCRRCSSPWDRMGPIGPWWMEGAVSWAIAAMVINVPEKDGEPVYNQSFLSTW